jgi:3-oxoacyl-(acyl-carrier-protein) synthase
MLQFATAKLLLDHKFLSVWDRVQGGVCLGSASGFLLLESSESIAERCVQPLAKISQPKLTQTVFLPDSGDLVLLSSLGGYPGHLQQQKTLWSDWQTQNILWVRGLATLTGTLLGATFPSYLIFALQCLQRQQLFAPIPSVLNIERPFPENQELNKIWVHNQGHLLGHALACLERV